MVTDAKKTPPKEEAGRYRSGLALATLAYAAIVSALIGARALVDALAFVSLGWIIVLGVVPLVPWLVPTIAPLFRRIAPFVQHVKLPGGFEIALSAAARPSASLGPVEATLTSDHLVHQLTMTNTPFTMTDAQTLIEGVQSVRAAGAEVVTVDLANGQKWRLPNLYFLAWILANGPTTRWLVFIETRADVTNAYVGLASAARLLSCVETAYAEYKVAATRLEFHDASQLQNQAPLADEFNKMRGVVAPAQAGETARAPVLGDATPLGIHESWPCKSNPVRLVSCVSRALLARREIAGFRPGSGRRASQDTLVHLERERVSPGESDGSTGSRLQCVQRVGSSCRSRRGSSALLSDCDHWPDAAVRPFERAAL